ncbi:MAG: GNAT family N-acetyltransferase [Chloroflexi bacterium]|nr:GNAT family N-acetyltransferase [Chloroflexota bacterium]
MSEKHELLGGRGYARQKLEFDHQLEMVHPFGDLNEFPSPPDGYLLRQFRPGEDDAKYMAVYGLAFESREIIPWIIANQVDEGFFVVEHIESGALVASSIAQKQLPPRWSDGGSLGWLVTDPEHTGKGLGTLVVSAVDNRLKAEGFGKAYLSTDDFRLPAISIYLKQGWKPRLHIEGMAPRWRDIYALLGLEFFPENSVLD